MDSKNDGTTSEAEIKPGRGQLLGSLGFADLDEFDMFDDEPVILSPVESKVEESPVEDAIVENDESEAPKCEETVEEVAVEAVVEEEEPLAAVADEEISEPLDLEEAPVEAEVPAQPEPEIEAKPIEISDVAASRIEDVSSFAQEQSREPVVVEEEIVEEVVVDEVTIEEVAVEEVAVDEVVVDEVVVDEATVEDAVVDAKPDPTEPLDLACPSCDKKLSLQRAHIGIEGACIYCETQIVAKEFDDGVVAIVRVKEEEPEEVAAIAEPEANIEIAPHTSEDAEVENESDEEIVGIENLSQSDAEPGEETLEDLFNEFKKMLDAEDESAKSSAAEIEESFDAIDDSEFEDVESDDLFEDETESLFPEDAFAETPELVVEETKVIAEPESKVTETPEEVVVESREKEEIDTTETAREEVVVSNPVDSNPVESVIKPEVELAEEISEPTGAEVEPAAETESEELAEAVVDDEELIDLKCPSCQAELTINNSLIGVQGACVECSVPIVAHKFDTGEIAVIRVQEPESDGETEEAIAEVETDTVSEESVTEVPIAEVQTLINPATEDTAEDVATEPEVEVVELEVVEHSLPEEEEDPFSDSAVSQEDPWATPELEVELPASNAKPHKGLEDSLALWKLNDDEDVSDTPPPLPKDIFKSDTDGDSSPFPIDSATNLFAELPNQSSLFEPLTPDAKISAEKPAGDTPPPVPADDGFSSLTKDEAVESSEKESSSNLFGEIPSPWVDNKPEETTSDSDDEAQAVSPFGDIPTPWGDAEPKEESTSEEKISAKDSDDSESTPLPWDDEAQSDSKSLFTANSPFGIPVDGEEKSDPLAGEKKTESENEVELEEIVDPFKAIETSEESFRESSPAYNSQRFETAGVSMQNTFAKAAQPVNSKRLSNTIIILLLIVIGTVSGASIAAFFVPVDDYIGKAKVYSAGKSDQNAKSVK
ncbi:MAG: hypothetical protein P1U89_12125 [Verrucomicrobiales bacterium]|nr:hypothetical protein [Verrucomicrobiales bacterium]